MAGRAARDRYARGSGVDSLTVDSEIEPAQLDREEEHQDIGDEEFGHGDGGQRDRIDDAVEQLLR